MTLLHGTLTLHDCRDVEKLCRRALHDRGAHQLAPHLYDDALTYLITAVWKASLTYNPARDRAAEKGLTPSFANYAIHIARNRYTDWQREEWKRDGSRRETLSLDTIIANDEHHDALGVPDSSDNADSDATRRRLYAQRDMHRTRYLAVIRATLLTPSTNGTHPEGR